MRIYIDIETQPTQDPAVIEEITSGVKPPGNYTKRESRETWLLENGHQAIQEAIGKTALSAEDGNIISISFAEDDGDPTTITPRPEAYDEKKLLQDFSQIIISGINEESIPSVTKPEPYRFEPYWIGHNVRFDLGFLWRRMVVHGIPTRGLIPSPDQLRHGKNCHCTMEAWAGHRERISLDKLCRTLGIASPKAGGIDGSYAWKIWRAGGVNEVSEYNARDVIATRAIFARLEGMND